MCTILKDPRCLSLDMMVPTRPLLAPPVIMQRLPVSNLMVSWILPVAMSTWTLSCTLTAGSGKRMVLPSEVYRKGTFLGPVLTSRTRHNLYLASVLSFPSILIRRCLQMVSTSFMVRAYFRRFLRNRAIGRDSPCLWGPELGLMVKTPPSLSSIHDLGAAKRFKCFLGPLGILRFYFYL